MDNTKKTKRIYIILTIISFLLLFGPILVALGIAVYHSFIAGVATISIAKVSIFSTSVIIFGMLTIISIARKMVFKSSVWVLVVALHLLLTNIAWMVVTIGVCQIVDELIITPLRKYYKQRWVINKEMDKRGV